MQLLITGSESHWQVVDVGLPEVVNVAVTGEPTVWPSFGDVIVAEGGPATVKLTVSVSEPTALVAVAVNV